MSNYRIVSELLELMNLKPNKNRMFYSKRHFDNSVGLSSKENIKELLYLDYGIKMTMYDDNKYLLERV